MHCPRNRLLVSYFKISIGRFFKTQTEIHCVVLWHYSRAYETFIACFSAKLALGREQQEVNLLNQDGYWSKSTSYFFRISRAGSTYYEELK